MNVMPFFFTSVSPEMVNKIDILVCESNKIPLHMSFVLRSHPLSEQFHLTQYPLPSTVKNILYVNDLPMVIKNCSSAYYIHKTRPLLSIPWEYVC